MASRKKKKEAEPAELPKLHRRLKFGVAQLLGLAVLVLIPVLALFQVFGQGEAHVSARSVGLNLALEYPPRLRHGTVDVLVAEIQNSSGALMDTVTVVFDSTYVSKMAEPRFTPPVTRAFELDLLNVQPGESRRIELTFHADEYWSHSGYVLASHRGDTARVKVQTFVLP